MSHAHGASADAGLGSRAGGDAGHAQPQDGRPDRHRTTAHHPQLRDARSNPERLRKLIAFANLSPGAVAVLTRATRSLQRTPGRAGPQPPRHRDPETAPFPPASSAFAFGAHSSAFDDGTASPTHPARRHRPDVEPVSGASQLIDTRCSCPVQSSAQRMSLRRQQSEQQQPTRLRRAESAWAVQASFPHALHPDDDMHPGAPHMHSCAVIQPQQHQPQQQQQRYSLAIQPQPDCMPPWQGTCMRSEAHAAPHDTAAASTTLEHMASQSGRAEHGEAHPSPPPPATPHPNDDYDNTDHAAAAAAFAESRYSEASLSSADRSRALKLKPVFISAAHRQQSGCCDSPCAMPSPSTLTAGSRQGSGGTALLQAPCCGFSVPNSTLDLTPADWTACADDPHAEAAAAALVSDWTMPRPTRRRARAASQPTSYVCHVGAAGALPRGSSQQQLVPPSPSPRSELPADGAAAAAATHLSGTSSGSHTGGLGSGSCEWPRDLIFSNRSIPSAFLSASASIAETSADPADQKPKLPPPARRDTNRGRQLQQPKFELVTQGSAGLEPPPPLAHQPSSSVIAEARGGDHSDVPRVGACTAGCEHAGCASIVATSGGACGGGESPTQGHTRAGRGASQCGVSCGFMSLVRRVASKWG